MSRKLKEKYLWKVVSVVEKEEQYFFFHTTLCDTLGIPRTNFWRKQKEMGDCFCISSTDKVEYVVERVISYS